MSDYGEIIISLSKKYKETGEPVSVDFRLLVDEIKNINRATHLIHPYPAKLLLHIPHLMINNGIFSNENETVYDPFCGSGTILLESVLSNRNAMGADINPLGRLISTVKTTDYDVYELQMLKNKILRSYKDGSTDNYPIVINLDYWYSNKHKRQLQCLYESIITSTEGKYSDFFLVCFSFVVKKLTNCDQNISVPVKMRYKQGIEYEHYNTRYKKRIDYLNNTDALSVFDTISNLNIGRFIDYNNKKKGDCQLIKMNNNALNNDIDDESVDLILTSPPYATAQKYIRSSSLSLGWLRLAKPDELYFLNNESIGRERCKKSECSDIINIGIDEADDFVRYLYTVNSMRGYIIGEYLNKMQRVIIDLYRILKKNKYMVLIVGNSQVLGKEMKTDEYIHKMCNKVGFNTEMVLIDKIKSRGLLMKRKYSNYYISHESIMVFKK
jgi:DNA modification methylase